MNLLPAHNLLQEINSSISIRDLKNIIVDYIEPGTIIFLNYNIYKPSIGFYYHSIDFYYHIASNPLSDISTSYYHQYIIRYNNNNLYYPFNCVLCHPELKILVK